MLKAVPDVNLHVSGAIKRNGHPAQILDRTEEFLPYTSEAILEDTARVLHYKRIQKRFNLTEEDILDYLEGLRITHTLVSGKLQASIVDADPDDDKIITCALEAGADYIITGDPHLLNLKEYREVRIVTPRAFLELLDREKSPG